MSQDNYENLEEQFADLSKQKEQAAAAYLHLKEMHDGLIEVGFTPVQAMRIVIGVISSAQSQ